MTSSETHISVVIPAFNSAAFIAQTLSAILRQTYRADRVIVVDDGSTDGTGDIVRQHSPSVDYIRITNGGQGAARKLAIEHSNSDWIALCDSDDLWNPDYLERRRTLLTAYPDAQFTFSDFYSFGPTSRPGHYLLSQAPNGWLDTWCTLDPQGFYSVCDPYRAFLAFNAAYPSGIVFRRNAYHRMGGFLPKYSRWIGEDAEFVRRFLLLPGVVVVGDSTQTWGYRRHHHNYSKVKWKNVYSTARILQEHLDCGIVPTQLQREVRSAIARTLADSFDAAYWEHCHEGAAEMYGKLTPRQRTLKRRIKGIWVRLRNQLD